MSGFGREIRPLPPSGTPDPNRSFPVVLLNAAAAIADPEAVAPRPELPDGVPDHVLLAARVQVRRIVAALSGVTSLLGENEQHLDALTVVPHPLLEQLQQAVCDPRVSTALGQALGTDAANRLVDALASIP